MYYSKYTFDVQYILFRISFETTRFKNKLLITVDNLIFLEKENICLYLNADYKNQKVYFLVDTRSKKMRGSYLHIIIINIYTNFIETEKIIVITKKRNITDLGKIVNVCFNIYGSGEYWKFIAAHNRNETTKIRSRNHLGLLDWMRSGGAFGGNRI